LTAIFRARSGLAKNSSALTASVFIQHGAS